jgi:hypothetical protein
MLTLRRSVREKMDRDFCQRARVTRNRGKIIVLREPSGEHRFSVIFYDIKAQLLEDKGNIIGTGVHRKVPDNCLDRLIGICVNGEMEEFTILEMRTHPCSRSGAKIDPFGAV